MKATFNKVYKYSDEILETVEFTGTTAEVYAWIAEMQKEAGRRFQQKWNFTLTRNN